MTIDRLRDEILAKKPVINTRFAEQIVTEPHNVESDYGNHYHTHVSLGDTDAFTQRLIKRVAASQTTKGAVVAPWGYGKTSTLIFTWMQCEQAGIIATPPFICSSLQDILNATYGWLRFRLGTAYYAELQDVFDRYGRVAFEDRVKDYVAQTGVSEADARSVLQKAMDDGSFSPELTASNLMDFLKYGAELAVRAGFKGLVVLADELQQFIDKSADLRATIQKLREVMLWLATHTNLHLGVVLCLPSGTESGLQEGGTDVLDRLKTDNLYIPLRSIYSPDFPRQLWERYTDHYEVGEEADLVLDRYLLAALGQIATREDLGRGPRTVIDVLQCAFRHYEKTGETYTPISLIDDFLTNQISFSEQSNEIRFAVEDAFSLLRSQATTEEHQRAIKLWAAFPEHGCPDEVLAAYGAKEAAEELTEMHGVHGALLTYQSVGYTLRKLASYTPGGTAVERMARDFWLVYKEHDPQWVEAAQAAFIEYVLPRIFEVRRNAWEKWDLRLTTNGSYAGCLTGSFSDEYPKRLVDIQVAVDPLRIEPRSANAQSDFQFDFVLQQYRGTETGSDPGNIEFVAENLRWVRFQLNLGNRALAKANLPQDLRNLKSSINPNFLTPQLMLAFVAYREKWEQRPDNLVAESDRGPLNAITENMLNYAIRVLFSDEIKATFSKKLDFTGFQIVREVFVLMCRQAWPEGTYCSLLNITDRALREYEEAIKHLPLREKRGDVTLSEQQKGKLARLFGIESHATFEGRAKADYSYLMQYRDLGGDKAAVQLQLHPLEQAFIDAIAQSTIIYQVGERDVPAIEGTECLDMAHEKGYRDEEAQIALRLLVARELVRVDKDAGLIYRLPVGPSVQEIQRGLQRLQERAQGLPKQLVAERDRNSLVREVGSLVNRYSSELDEEALEQLAVDIGHLEERLDNLVNHELRRLSEQIATFIQQIQQRKGALSKMAELEEEAPAGLDFRSHLMSFQETFRKDRRAIGADLTKMDQQFRKLHEQGSHLTSDEIAVYSEEYNRAVTQLDQLEARIAQLEVNRKGLIDWFRLLKESDALFRSLGPWNDLRKRLIDSLVPEIRQNLTQRFSRQEFSELANDAEVYRDRFEEIRRDLDSRTKAGNEAFGDRKQRYRQWLGSMGVDRSDFPARYDPLDHEGAYQDMYEQVRSIAVSHLNHRMELLQEIDRSLLYARLIRYQKLTGEEQNRLSDAGTRHTSLQSDLERVYLGLSDIDFAQIEEEDLEQYANAVRRIELAIDELGQEIRQLIGPPLAPQTPEEEKVMSLLAGRHDVIDLTELALSIADELDLEALMSGLLGLYRENQVSIRVQRRG